MDASNKEKPLVLDQNKNVIKRKESPTARRKTKIKRLLFGVIWFYFIIRVFITDIDLLLTYKYLSLTPSVYITLRILLTSLIILFIWIKAGNIRFWKNVGSFILYPIYPGATSIVKTLFWSVPKEMIDRKWQSLLYNYIDWTISFFVKFKYTLSKFILFLLAFILLFSLESYFLIIPILIFIILQVAHLYRRYKETFEPIRVFQIKLDFTSENIQEEFANEKLREKIEKAVGNIKDADEEKAFMKQMEHFLLISEFTSAFNTKMKNALNNRSYLKSFLWKAVFSLLISMVFFGGVNYGIYKYDPLNFKIEVGFIPKYFHFFYYSFFTIIPDGTDIEPATNLAKMIRMAGVIVGIFINLLVLAVYFTVSSDKYKENLEKAIKFTDESSKEIRNYFIEKYGHEPTEGINKLKSLGSTIEMTLKSVNDLLNPKR